MRLDGFLPASTAAHGRKPSHGGNPAHRRRVRRRAVNRPAPADFRDACGLKWEGSLPNWWIAGLLLRWACRNNRE
jgi:hypothetical protein